MAGAGPLALSALLLLWPALVNGYPLVFSDTGTYLSQAVHHYLGWDRPVFYSLFIFPLHMQLTTWPVIVVQALLTAGVLHLVRRSLRPELSAWWLVPLTAVLALVSPLAVVTDELMPDLFTALLVLTLASLILVPERLSHGEQLCLAVFAAFAIMTHLSNLPLTLVLLAVLLPLRCRLGAAAALGRDGLARLVAVPAAAAVAMTAVNLAGHRVASPAPFGNIFVLARVLYDGPGMDALARACPRPGWRLCAYLGRFPPDADAFLWQSGSPLYRAGGPKLVSTEATAIVVAAVRAEPLRELQAVGVNGVRQLLMFDTGDGLQPWPRSVTPWIERDFPASERAEYERARQTEGREVLPGWVPGLDMAASLTGLAVCLVLLPGLLRRRKPHGGFIVAMLVALAANALITGGLSGPHDRYQSRVMWLPAFLALLTALPGSVRLPPATAIDVRIAGNR